MDWERYPTPPPVVGEEEKKVPSGPKKRKKPTIKPKTKTKVKKTDNGKRVGSGSGNNGKQVESLSLAAVTTRKRIQAAFLESYVNTGSVTEAASVAGIARKTAYEWSEKYPAFLQAWKDCNEPRIQGLEAEAHRRAYKGSDLLMIFLLKAGRPEVYRDRFDISMTTRREDVIEIVLIPADKLLPLEDGQCAKIPGTDTPVLTEGKDNDSS